MEFPARVPLYSPFPFIIWQTTTQLSFSDQAWSTVWILPDFPRLTGVFLFHCFILYRSPLSFSWVCVHVYLLWYSCAIGAGTAPFHLLKCLVHSPIHGELVLLSLVSSTSIYWMLVLYEYFILSIHFIYITFHSHTILEEFIFENTSSEMLGDLCKVYKVQY